MKEFIKTVHLNKRELFSCWGNIAAIIVTITCLFLPFCSSEPWISIVVVIASIVLSFIIAAIYIGFLKQKRTLYVRGNSTIICRYGDLNKIAKKENESIIVIPVNDGFDMQMSNPSKGGKPLISSNSIHGSWIEFVKKEMGISEKDIDNLIESYLESQNISPIETLSGTNRNNKRYPIGTCAIIPGPNNNLYCLTVVSPTDDDNRTRGNKNTLKECVKQLFDFYDKKGQGYKIYIPLLGTGLSNSVTLGESYSIIYATALLTISKWSGEVNIVIYDKNKSKIEFNNGIRIK